MWFNMLVDTLNCIVIALVLGHKIYPLLNLQMPRVPDMVNSEEAGDKPNDPPLHQYPPPGLEEEEENVPHQGIL